MKKTVRGLMFLLIVFSLLPGGLAGAGVVFEEGFDGLSTGGGTVFDGRFVAGHSGEGWQGTSSDRIVPHKEYIVYDLPANVFGQEGTVEFYLRRESSVSTGDGQDVVFQLLNADLDTLFRLAVTWDHSRKDVVGEYPILNLTSPPMNDMGGGPWGGGYFSFGRPVAVGEWVHIAVTWGEEPRMYRIYLDGRDISGQAIGYSDPEKLSDSYLTVPVLFASATRMQLGGETLGDYDPELVSFSTLNDSLLDEFRIHDVAFNPLDPQPVIGTVNHDAFEVAGYSGKLVVGDTLTVRISTDTGGTASFDLVQPEVTSGGKVTPGRVISSAVPMVEDPENPGAYTGTYTIRSGDAVVGGEIVGHFTSGLGTDAQPVTASRTVDIDGRVHLGVNASNDLVPADESARAGLTVVAENANGKAVRDHELKLTLSTTDEYTGTVGGGSFEDQVGGTIDVDWGGVTDSFGEVTAQYISGFAAKTILVSAKDMATGDVGVGWVRSFIDGTVDIVVTEPKVSALSVTGSMDVSLSRDWLTADGQSRSRITAVVKDASGEPLSGHSVQFTLLGDNGVIRVVQGKTDSRGRAVADYIAGTVMGQVQVEVRDLTSGLTAIVSIELRPDAPAEITLTADPAEVVTGGETTVTAKVTDVNKNPNRNVDVLYDISVGEGTVSAKSVATDEKGNASVTFTAGDAPGLVTLRGTVISREPTAEEISAAKGAVFLYGLAEDPGRLDVIEWLAEPGDEVVEGQPLVTLEDRADTVYTVMAPRDGILATFVAEERDRVEYGDTLGYVIEVAE